MQEDVEPPRGTVSTALDEPAQTLQKKASAAISSLITVSKSGKFKNIGKCWGYRSGVGHWLILL